MNCRLRSALLVTGLTLTNTLCADEPVITLEASSSTINQATAHMAFVDIHISQDELSLTSKSASTNNLDFANSEWEFRDNVVLKTPYAHLKASSANLIFRDYRLVRVLLNGSPLALTDQQHGDMTLLASSGDIRLTDNEVSKAEFQGTPVIVEVIRQDTPAPIEGEADRLRIDFATSHITLEGNAKLSDAGNSMSGERISYDLSKQQVIAESDPQTRQPVHIIINPNAVKPPANNED